MSRLCIYSLVYVCIYMYVYHQIRCRRGCKQGIVPHQISCNEVNESGQMPHLEALRAESFEVAVACSARAGSEPSPRLRLLPKARLTDCPAGLWPAPRLLRAGVGKPICLDLPAEVGLPNPLCLLLTLWDGEGGSARPAGTVLMSFVRNGVSCVRNKHQTLANERAFGRIISNMIMRSKPPRALLMPLPHALSQPSKQVHLVAAHAAMG